MQEEKGQGVDVKVVPEQSTAVSSITNPMLSKLVSNDTEEGNKLPLLSSSHGHSSSIGLSCDLIYHDDTSKCIYL